MTLRQTNEALIVTDEGRSLMSRYAFDGRETSNPGPGDAAVRSTAQWEGAALVIESVLTLTGPQGDMTLSTREVRSLSQDGPYDDTGGDGHDAVRHPAVYGDARTGRLAR